MHVIIIANGFQSDYILNLVNNLAPIIDRVDLIGSDIYPIDSFDKRVHFFNIRGSHVENVSIIKKVRRILSYYIKLYIFIIKSKATCVHVQWLRFSLLEGVFINFLLRITGQKLVYTAHDILPHDRDNLINRSIFYLIYHLYPIIIVHTDYLKSRIVNEFKVSPKKIFIVKHGVYEVIYRYGKEKSRKKLTIASKDFVFLFFGYIKAYKGIDILLEAFAKLSTTFSDATLLFAGKIDKEYETECRITFMRYNDHKIIKNFGFIPDEELSIYFEASDITVLPYLEASQSGVMFMSYAHGIPVIVPNLGGFPADIIDGTTGLLFETGNVDSLYKTMEESIYKFKPSNKTSFAIKEYASQNYSWKASCIELKNIYS